MGAFKNIVYLEAQAKINILSFLVGILKHTQKNNADHEALEKAIKALGDVMLYVLLYLLKLYFYYIYLLYQII